MSFKRNRELLTCFITAVALIGCVMIQQSALEEEHRINQPFENGLMAQARIDSVATADKGGVLASFKDSQGKEQQARVENHSTVEYRKGEQLIVSYQADDMLFVRVPWRTMSGEQYQFLNKMFWCFHGVGIFIILMGLYRRFVRAPVKDGIDTATLGTSYVVKKSVFRTG